MEEKNEIWAEGYVEGYERALNQVLALLDFNYPPEKLKDTIKKTLEESKK